MAEQLARPFFKKLIRLSELGCPQSQSLVRNLLDLCNGTMEDRALTIWLETVAPEIAEEYEITSVDDVKGGRNLLVVHPIEENILHIGVREGDRDGSITITEPTSDSVGPLSEYLSTLSNILFEGGLHPGSAQASLDGFSKIKLTGIESPKHRVVLSGVRYLCSSALSKLGELICEGGRWYLPDKSTKLLRTELDQLLTSYPRRLELLQLREDFGSIDRELSAIEQCGLELLSIVGQYVEVPKASEIPIEVLAKVLNDPQSQRLIFEVTSTVDEKAELESIMDPILERVLYAEINDCETGQVLKIQGPDLELLKDVIKPLHSRFNLRLK